MTHDPAPGPLAGLRVLEIGAVGPIPFVGMLLADMGAEVARVARPFRPGSDHAPDDPTLRGRVAVTADLKTDEGRETVRKLARVCDVLLEGSRPGVMERLGLGPGELIEANPKLVYGRMTGYGQDGPLSNTAGHDLNFIATSGVLDSLRRDGQPPMFPLNLLGDYAGGAMFMIFGVLCAVVEAQRSGQGQVVDAAMIDGVSSLATFVHGMRGDGTWADRPGTNVLDGGAPFYEVYETSDGGHVAVASVEPRFYSELLSILEIPEHEIPQWDRAGWPASKRRLATIFGARTRKEWEERFAGSDACVTPVLRMPELGDHPHHAARASFTNYRGNAVPVVAPRLSRTPGRITDSRELEPGEVLRQWGAH